MAAKVLEQAVAHLLDQLLLPLPRELVNIIQSYRDLEQRFERILFQYTWSQPDAIDHLATLLLRHSQPLVKAWVQKALTAFRLSCASRNEEDRDALHWILKWENGGELICHRPVCYYGGREIGCRCDSPLIAVR